MPETPEPALTPDVGDYCVAEAEDSTDLAVRVRRLMQEGWRPFGSVSVAGVKMHHDSSEGEWDYIEWAYCQAMTRVLPPEAPPKD